MIQYYMIITKYAAVKLTVSGNKKRKGNLYGRRRRLDRIYGRRETIGTMGKHDSYYRRR